MKEENVILEKSYSFALQIMSLAKAIREKKEYDLASQLWRAGTSIGANVEDRQKFWQLIRAKISSIQNQTFKIQNPTLPGGYFPGVEEHGRKGRAGSARPAVILSM